VAEEDARRPGRERQRLVSERVAQSNRISGLLATHGIYGYRPLRADRWDRLAELRCADGRELPELLHEEIVRALTRLEFVQGQIKAVEKRRATKLGDEDRGARYTRALMRFYGIGIEIASVLAREVYYRDFANRRQVGSYVGLSGSPYQSGERNHEQGISKAGNRLARHKAIELAWLWLKHQPQSALSRWFYARLGTSQSKRFKRILAVALARKLVVALWRYLSAGLVPEGARLEPR